MEITNKELEKLHEILLLIGETLMDCEELEGTKDYEKAFELIDEGVNIVYNKLRGL